MMQEGQIILISQDRERSEGDLFKAKKQELKKRKFSKIVFFKIYNNLIIFF